MTAESRPRALPSAVLDAMPGAVAQLSEQGEILSVNDAWRTLAASGRLLPSTNVTPGTNYLDACDDAAARGVAAASDAAAAARVVLAGRLDPIALEFTVHQGPQPAWCELLVTRLDGAGFRGALVHQVDITPRRAAAEALLRSENQYRAIVESAPVGIYRSAPDGTILAANQTLADIVGAGSPAEIVGTNMNRFYAQAGERDALIAQHPPGGATVPMELEWRRVDGAPIWVQLAARAIADPAGRTLHWEGFAYDISERKHLEAQLVQAQKMESVGRLAGGIAHDFNNLLTVMIGYAELLHTSAEMPQEFRPPVGEILSAARRAAELTGRMLAFARKQRVQPRAVNVNDVVRSVEGLLRRIIGEDIRLEANLPETLPPVLIDPAQLEQVLMNLAVNARDAMPKGGTLTIATEVVEISDEQARRRPGLRAGRQVRLSVADTGTGMDRETLARVFEPFFTTKEPGKGTGLGLAMCYGIVKQANGFIGCESAPGAGTTCTVLLPCTSEATVRPKVPDSPPAPRPRPRETRARILVVEDEPVVRRFVAEVLRNSGHQVEAAESSVEGLERATRQGFGLDLLVTDVVMPVMDGVTLAARIRAHQPKLRVLLMSGYQDRGSAALEPGALLIQKPFTAAQLRAKVEEALVDGL